MEIGKRYRHKKVGSEIEVRGEYYGKAERTAYFTVILLKEQNGLTCISKPMLLPKEKAPEWELIGGL